MRLLAAARLSRMQNESSSPESQRAAMQGYAALYGHQIVASTTDLDVSGAVSPFDRAELGPWLRDDRLASWDGLIVSKLDRLSRSLLDFAQLAEWCLQRGKVLISVAESLDQSTAAGRLCTDILVRFAQFERERMAERRKDAAVTLRKAGRWGGGSVPYGYKAEKSADGWRLVQDQATAAVIWSMADDAIEGISNGQIARQLQSGGVSTPWDASGKKPRKDGKPREWLAETVRLILTSRNLIGESVSHGEVVRDNGMPVMFTDEPLITASRFAELQAALGKRSQVKGDRVGGHQLLRVAYCLTDGKPLYGHIKTGRGYGYYRCQKCGYQIRMDKLEQYTSELLISQLGDRELTEKKFIAGEDHSRELARVEKSIADLRADRYERGLFSGEQGSAEYADWMAKLEAKREIETAKQSRPDRYELVPSGETFGQRWARLDSQARGQFLRDCGVRVLPEGDGSMTSMLLGDLEEMTGKLPAE